ncbi:MAG: hypothetical protein HY432_01515 [Candidatus Liptonbacteria bacterium]|nr:hypothetical protein [Candidatus Liptonbacteria bacterium]
MWPIFKTKEKFLLLDVSAEKISGLLISLDDRKKIRKEKVWENMEKDLSSGRSRVPVFADKTIVACEPELAFKIFVPLSMKRESSNKPIERTELENILAQAIAKIFNHCRREASLVLGMDELDTILADSNISEFEIDGHRVINPLGFKPAEIRAVIKMTFAGRDTFERVKAVRKKKDFFFTEKWQAQASAIARTDSKRADLLSVCKQKSYLYYPEEDPDKATARKEIRWSVDALTDEIKGIWDLNSKAAANVYEYYAGEGVSVSLDRYFKKIFSKAVKNLLSQIKKLKTSAKIYVIGNIRVDLIGKNPFCEPPFRGFIEKSGFEIDMRKPSPDSEVFQQLAPFFEFYYDNSESEINDWLKRRLNWLGSST